MSTSGLLMMIGTWLVISWFTVRLFVKVLKTPQEKAESTPEGGD